MNKRLRNTTVEEYLLTKKIFPINNYTNHITIVAIITIANQMGSMLCVLHKQYGIILRKYL